MQHLIAKLHLRQTQGAVLTPVLPHLNSYLAENFSDVTFKLPDGSSVPGHRLILAIASPFFEAQFYGRSLIPESNSECIFPSSCRHM